jgi:hypothetical protein
MTEQTNVTRIERGIDDLRELKEGDIVVDENGKKYRVKKTMLPQTQGTGPAGMGKEQCSS